MNTPNIPVVAFALCIGLAAVPIAYGHCDGLDGPVVAAARLALDSNQVERALIWVPSAEEGTIRESFRKTLAVRKMSGEAKNLADMYFFETLVRIHRNAEGASYDGLKPAGRDLGAAIPMADIALKTGKLEPLAKLLETSVHEGLKRRFQESHAGSRYPRKDVAKGREFVSHYVEFIHYVERLHVSAAGPAAGHYEEKGQEHAEGEAPHH